MLDRLKQANPHIEILDTQDPGFALYGVKLEAEPLQDMFELLDRLTTIPSAGNVYVPCDAALESTQGFGLLGDNFYGGMPIQAGYCNGHSDTLSALEYHRGCEVTLAATSFILLLARLCECEGGQLDTGVVKAYYIERGEAVALHETTLHLSPSQVTKAGFKAGIVLPRGTNAPLEKAVEPVFGQDALLFMRNKWLMAHPNSVQAREKGAYVGIKGEPISIVPID